MFLQSRAPIYVSSSEVWLRSWIYQLPALGVSATAPLPHWALVPDEVHSSPICGSENERGSDCSRFIPTIKKELTSSTAESGADVAKKVEDPVDHSRQSINKSESDRFTSGVYMLYTNNDTWAPCADYHFFAKKFSSGHHGTHDTATGQFNPHVSSLRPEDNMHFIPGLKHAFVLSQSSTDIVVDAMTRRMEFTSK